MTSVRFEKAQRWYPGADGIPGDQYEGEASRYDGPEMWQVTYKDWRTGSDLALALLRLDAEGGLAEGRAYHLERRVHLHSNRLGLSLFDEARLYLHLAIGYFNNVPGFPANPFGADVLRDLQNVNDRITRAL